MVIWAGVESKPGFYQKSFIRFNRRSLIHSKNSQTWAGLRAFEALSNTGNLKPEQVRFIQGQTGIAAPFRRLFVAKGLHDNP